jgi:hypothetical protein
MYDLKAAEEVEQYLRTKVNEFLNETGVLERDLERIENKKGTGYKWSTEILSFVTLRRVIKDVARNNKRQFIVVYPMYKYPRQTQILLGEYHIKFSRVKRLEPLFTYLYLLAGHNATRHTSERICRVVLTYEQWQKTKDHLRTSNELRETIGLPRR